MKTDRLLKLADFLETLPRARFDMRHFWEGHGCKSSGCALGWAAHKRMFPELRLGKWNTFKVNGEETCSATFATAATFADPGDLDAGNDIYDGCFQEPRGADGLFMRSTPKQTARRIRKFVAQNSPSGV